MDSDNTSELITHGITFFAWTGAVGLITFLICRAGASTGDSGDDYFAGGRSLQWFVVAGSLMLTNLSSEQLVGLNGAVFKDGCLVGIWWEAGAAVAMVFTATVFLPQYMAQNLITTSGFLGERYDKAMRTLVSLIFLGYYTLILCPLVLYTGAIGIIGIFDLTWPLWTISTAIGFLGSLYAIFGGLKAVAISDCLNGIGLLVVGLWVPYAAIQTLPNTWSDLFDEPRILRIWAETSDVYNADHKPLPERQEYYPSIPWHTTFLGMTLNNMYYWATNQLIVQRVLGARSMSDGQKGVLFAATMKVMGFAFLCVPGLVAILMQDLGVKDQDGNVFQIVGNTDTTYPTLVRAVMPRWSLGFVLGVLLGSVLSTFNSALNSASTMFGLEIYKEYIKPDADQDNVVFAANIFGVFLTLFSFVIAPLLAGVGGIFNFLQNMNTIMALPILSVFFVGVFTKVPDAVAGKAGFLIGFIAICLGQFLKDDNWLHFLHIFEGAFLLAMLTIAIVTYTGPIRTLFGASESPVPYEAKPPAEGAKVDQTLWKFTYPISAAVVSVLALLLASLQLANQIMLIIFWVCWGAVMLGLMLSPVETAGPPTGESELAQKFEEGS